MTAKEMIIKLGECGVMSVDVWDNTNQIYVEDCESYVGCAYLTFDENGNCIKVEEA